MRKKTFLLIGLISLFLAQALLISGASAARSSSQWTFMIYACADNDLEKSWTEDLKELERVGSTDLVDFVALVDLLSTNTVELIHIEQDSYTVVETYDELNMGDPQVCVDFVNTVKLLYPAEKYLLDFWNHGDGWNGFCWDDTSGDWLNLQEMHQSMEDAGFIDIVGFDACDMAQAEVAYELVDHAGYMVASEEYEEYEGWPYTTHAQDLVDHPKWNAKRYAIEIVANYGEYYEPFTLEQYTRMTCSVINIDWMPHLRKVFTDWTSAMLVNLDQYKEQYKQALANAETMSDTYFYVDMLNFTVEFDLLDLNNVNLNVATKKVKHVVSKAIVVNWAGKAVPDCNGLSFYWPGNQSAWYSARDNYLLVNWAQATGWANFLDAYFT